MIANVDPDKELPNPDKPSVRRGLVIEGGGGKAAFALGCMKAFRDRGITFDAVAGTSAGALCALIWATDSVDDGERVWLSIGRSTFFGLRPHGCIRRLTKILLTGGKLYAAYVRNIELEGQPQFARDTVCSIALGLLYWLLLIGLIPTLWLWILFPIIIPAVALFAFTNELPRLGWDSRTRKLLLDVLLWLITTKTLLGLIAWLLPVGSVIGRLDLPWFPVVLGALLIASILLALDFPSTLIEGKSLAAHVRTFLSKRIRMPIYVTVAKEAEPGSPHFMLPTPGVFACVYARLDEAPPELTEAFAYASAALPFGILPSVRIGQHVFVDGGVADNTPALPLIGHELDELWIIRLRPTRIDLAEHFRSLLVQQMFATRPVRSPAHEALESAMAKLRVIQILPQADLGGMLTGTLNFSERRSAVLLRHGYRVGSKVAENPHQVLRTYQRKFTFRQRLAFVLKAMPDCDLLRILGRGTADTSAPHPNLDAVSLRLPNAVRPARHDHSAPVMSGARFSIAVVSSSLAWAAFGEGRTLAGSLWIFAALWVLFVLPSWWPRFRRMQGF